MEQPATWEWVLVGIGLALMLFFWVPGIRRAVAQSRNAPKDWAGVLLPIGVVVLFIILLIASVR